MDDRLNEAISDKGKTEGSSKSHRSSSLKGCMKTF